MSSEKIKTLELQLYVAIECTVPESEVDVRSEYGALVDELLADVYSEKRDKKTMLRINRALENHNVRFTTTKKPMLGLRFIDTNSGEVMTDHRRQYEP